MSRAYKMEVEIMGYNKNLEEQIIEAAGKEWYFPDDWDIDDGGAANIMTNGSQSYLAGGEDADEFTRRLSYQVWRANQGFCKVHVVSTYMEDLPCEEHDADEEEFELQFAATAKICKFCGGMFPDTDILDYHEGQPVCPDCWDERLRVTK